LNYLENPGLGKLLGTLKYFYFAQKPLTVGVSGLFYIKVEKNALILTATILYCSRSICILAHGIPAK